MENARLEKIFLSMQSKSSEQNLENFNAQINVTFIEEFLVKIKRIILKEYFVEEDFTFESLIELQKMVQVIMQSKNNPQIAQKDSYEFLEIIPELRNIIHQDIESAFQKDPAANSYAEIALTYPGIFAILVHRVSHQLYKKGYYLVARMVSELSHSKTGIDIHPGASIGHHFFMDHGTGIVIGETTKIGNNVTIYQGVTLGAFSFQHDDNGMIIKGNKRHPTIEDGVTIYAGATILGGGTVVGKGSIIGGNVWLTQSVSPYSKVIHKNDSEILAGN